MSGRFFELRSQFFENGFESIGANDVDLGCAGLSDVHEQSRNDHEREAMGFHGGIVLKIFR
jgi:hypothetical protein